MNTLLTGENGYAIKTFLDQVQRDVIKDHPAATLEIRLAEDLGLEDLPMLLQNSSLFSDHKLVVIKDLGANKSLAEELVNYADKVAPMTDFYAVESQPDKRTKWFKSLSRRMTVKDFPHLTPALLVNWLKDYAKSESATINQSAAELLIARAGTDQWRLSQDLDKLISFNPEITKQNVALLVEETPRDTVFDLLDAVVAGHGQRAHQLYSQLRRAEIEPHQFLGLLSWQMHNMLIVRANYALNTAQLSAKAGLAPFVVDKTRRLVRRLTLGSIKYLIELILEADYDMKYRGLDADQRVKLLIDRIVRKIMS